MAGIRLPEIIMILIILGLISLPILGAIGVGVWFIRKKSNDPKG